MSYCLTKLDKLDKSFLQNDYQIESEGSQVNYIIHLSYVVKIVATWKIEFWTFVTGSGHKLSSFYGLKFKIFR
jgi:hypothetical protein